jgi:hypothetical protein
METGQKEKKLKPWTDYQGRIQYTSTAVAWQQWPRSPGL